MLMHNRLNHDGVLRIYGLSLSEMNFIDSNKFEWGSIFIRERPPKVLVYV